jgi:peptidoglycan hydrolase CwlO-like protein
MTPRKPTEKATDGRPATPQPKSTSRQPYVLQSSILISDLDQHKRNAETEIEAIDADILSITERANRDIAAINERKEQEITGRMERKADLELTVAIASAGLGAGKVGA